MKQPFTFNHIDSMMPLIKSSEFLYESATGETEWGKRKKRKREKESGRLTE